MNAEDWGRPIRPREGSRVIEVPLALSCIGSTALFTVLGFLGAYQASGSGCGARNMAGPPTSVSSFCHTTGFDQAFPGTITHPLLVGALYFTPALVAAVGFMLALRADSRRMLRVAQLVAAVLLVAGIIITALGAHASYEAG